MANLSTVIEKFANLADVIEASATVPIDNASPSYTTYILLFAWHDIYNCISDRFKCKTTNTILIKGREFCVD